MKISVCMATYNGQAYITRQLQSILHQLTAEDEIIIIDDCSEDNTVAIIKNSQDPRIRLQQNTRNSGVTASFARAIELATGDILFLSDQDDIWLNNKVKTVLEYFAITQADIIQHDAIVINNEQQILYNSYYQLRTVNSGLVKNFVANTFLGCCMAFKKEVKSVILPIPKRAAAHDRWIGIIGQLAGLKVVFINEQLLQYVRHEHNVSPLHRRNLAVIVPDRINLFIAVVVHYCKKAFRRNREDKRSSQ